MVKKTLNIKSSTVDKGLDLAKEFLGKLISPTIEEVGLLISDNIKFLRFKNQVRILLKAKVYVEKKNVNLKEIPIKILVPLLENASLEDNESLQDKWAKMLANMVDSNKNLQNQIFPFLLSQISIEEFDGLKELQNKEVAHLNDIKQLKLLEIEETPLNYSNRKKLYDRIEKTEQDGFLPDLQEFELANLQRLGLVRQLPPKIYIPEFVTGSNQTWGSSQEWHRLEASYNADQFGFRITELGQKFLSICDES